MFIFLAATFFGTGASVLSSGAVGFGPMAPAIESKPPVDHKPRVSEKKQPRLDVYGEPLPEGAVARMGTIQFRHPPSHLPLFYDLSGGPTMGVAFSPNGQVIATSLWKRLRLWHGSTGKFLFEIVNADLSWNVPAFSPDGRFIADRLARVYQDKAPEIYVNLWDAKTGKLRQRLPPKNGLATDMRHILFSPDGKRLAMTQENGAIHLWNTDTGKEIAVLLSKSSKTGPIASIAFTPDGNTLVVLPHQPRKLWRWDVAKGEVSKVVSLKTLDADKETEEGRTGRYHDYLLSEDGRMLASAFFGDRVVHLLDTATGKVRCRIQLPDTDRRHGRAFTPDGRLFALATYAKDGREIVVSLSDTETGKVKHQFTIAHQKMGPLTFSPDGSRMAVGTSPVRLYDVASGNELLGKPAHEGHVHALAFTPDGGTLISAGADGRIGIWDAATGKSRHLIQSTPWYLMGLALVPGGSKFVAAGQDGSIHLHDWRTGQEVRRFGFGPKPNRQFAKLTVSGDGKTVVSQIFTANESEEAPFYSWDLATGKLLRTFSRQGNEDFYDLAADGKRFIGVRYSIFIGDKGIQRGTDATVEIRELAGGRSLFTMQEADSQWLAGRSLLTADGRFLIRTTVPREIRLLELATGKDRLRIVSKAEDWAGYYDPIALAPDGRTLATTRPDNTIQLWDLATGKELMRRSGYVETVHAVTFSPSGRFLATGHEEGAILVWEVPLPTRKPSQPARSATELDSWWKDLAGEDAAKAHAAIWKLVEAPEQALGLFKDQLRPAVDNSERIAKLIAQLDDTTFTVRKAASKELKLLGSEAEPALRRALDQKPSLEKRHRIKEILDRASLLVSDPELLRAIRAVEALEYIAAGGADATRLAVVDLLKKLAGGASQARLTQEANAAAQRLETRRP
jgi:WD40 repeat protein